MRLLVFGLLVTFVIVLSAQVFPPSGGGVVTTGTTGHVPWYQSNTTVASSPILTNASGQISACGQTVIGFSIDCLVTSGDSTLSLQTTDASAGTHVSSVRMNAPGLSSPNNYTFETINHLTGGATADSWLVAQTVNGVFKGFPVAVYAGGDVGIGVATTFASATACSASLEGHQQPFTDSTTVVWGATITGGGANHVLGYCDGTNWTVMAK